MDKGGYRVLHGRILSARQDGLLRRCRGGKQKGARRPHSFYRKASKRWLMNLDNQFRSSMRTGGLKSFVRNDGIRVLLQQGAFNLLPDTEWAACEFGWAW